MLRSEKEDRQPERKECGGGPRAGTLARLVKLPSAPAVDNPGFDPGIILSCAAEVGVEVFDLD
jgi:hypothetical protein